MSIIGLRGLQIYLVILGLVLLLLLAIIQAWATKTESATAGLRSTLLLRVQLPWT